MKARMQAKDIDERAVIAAAQSWHENRDGWAFGILGYVHMGVLEAMVELMHKRGTIRASTLRARPLEEKADAAQAMIRHVMPLVEAGMLTVPVEATFPMAEAEAAFDRFSQGAKLGKLVLVVR